MEKATRFRVAEKRSETEEQGPSQAMVELKRLVEPRKLAAGTHAGVQRPWQGSVELHSSAVV